MSRQPPIVSIRGLTRGEPGALERVARELRSPCQEWGVFHVVDHDIPEAVLERFGAAMQALFAAPRRGPVSRTRQPRGPPPHRCGAPDRPLPGRRCQVCSDDRYVAPLHRLTANAERERFSAPFFLNPSYEARYAPIPSLMQRDESPRYREISWGHFRDRRSAGDYANYGAEIQISDYRVDVD